MVGAVVEGTQCSLAFTPSKVMLVPGVQTAPVGRGPAPSRPRIWNSTDIGNGWARLMLCGLWLANITPLLLRAQAGVSGRAGSSTR